MVLGIVCDTEVQGYKSFFINHTDIKLSHSIKEVLESKNLQQLVLVYINFFHDLSIQNLTHDGYTKIKQQYIKFITDAQKQDNTLKIVLFRNSHLLTQFLQTNNNITPARFLKYAKHHLLIQKRITEIVNASNVPTLVLSDFLYNFKKQNILKLKIFTNIAFSYTNLYKPPVLKHHIIPNWEYFFNCLSHTNYAEYLK